MTEKDREILRGLAKRQLENAKSERNKQTVELWRLHNDFHGSRPMLHIEIDTFENEIFPALMRCEGEDARKLERDLYHQFYNFEVFEDDKPVPDFFPVEWKRYFYPFGYDIAIERSVDSMGRSVGHRFLYPIQDLEEDLKKLEPSQFGVDKEGTISYIRLAEDAFGDILPVQASMQCLYAVPTQQVVHLMGLEAMMMALCDCPETFCQMMDRLAEDYIAWFKLMEREGCLQPTTGFQRLGQGSFCFTGGLPDHLPVTAHDVWGFLDSQETICISPGMFEEFVYPFYEKIAGEYGRLSYGCCEPVDSVWDCVSRLPGLAKVSISPWCNQEIMGERLRGNNIIFHRKPSPNFLGLPGSLDEPMLRGHIAETLRAARGCHLEITQRDVYTVESNPEKVRQYVRIIREEIVNRWKP